MALPTSIPLSALKPDMRMTQRAAPNPYDKATIWSIYPEPILETKRTIYPDTYLIPAGSESKPASLVIGPASWFRDFSIDEPLFEVQVSAASVAEAIVRDYHTSRWESNAGDVVPGIFWTPGECDLKTLVEKYSNILEKAIIYQRNWYQALIKQADSLWARTNGNPIAIPEDSKLACRELNQNRDWAIDFKKITMTPCPACGALRNPQFPICGSCKNVIDPKKATELGLVFAK